MEQAQPSVEHPTHHRHHGGRGRGRPVQETNTDRSSRLPSTDQHVRPDRPPTGPRRRPPQSEQSNDDLPSHTPRPSRRDRFKAKLTETSHSQLSDAQTAPPQASHRPEPTAETPEAEKTKPKPRPRHPRISNPPGDDLTSTLTYALRTPPFPDCPICFNPIRPEQWTWSCSPPASGTESRGQDAQAAQCCWNTYHLKCVRAWAEKSVKELEEAWRARGESKPGEWRCPGCRAARQAVPQTYLCFCLRMRNPVPPRIATPHSCAQPCSRSRSACKHACPLPCHPGPCPPCAVTIQVACFCGKEKHSAKCRASDSALPFSCAQPCRQSLQCGHLDHRCAQTCHEGLCPPCPVQEVVRCWCGRETKLMECGEAKSKSGTKCVVAKEDGSEEEWIGSYGCGRSCGRPFTCSNHSCSKPCHPPSRTPLPCPFDPERVVTCACGRHRVACSFNEFPSSNGTHRESALLKPRASCISPLPTCSSPCSKPLPCGHLCQKTCHWDLCPPCTEHVERTCRCGATKHKTPCGEAAVQRFSTERDAVLASETILCDKPCTAMRACGRHPCGRICCPLGPSQRAVGKSGKRRDAEADMQLQIQLDPAMRALHQCNLPCNRVLVCGNHRCQEGDHKGPCPPCPRGVFEELVCPCGRTVLEPPIRCGTHLACVYTCARAAPACGHPRIPHACHEGLVIAGSDAADEGLGLGVSGSETEGARCPPCVVLTEKVCACGKKKVGNVRCSQERVSCGSVCGKLLSCGFHHCERSCHGDPCGVCTATCGKSRKSCLPAHHPCTQTCHAPAACPETEPCLASVILTCPCGYLRSTVPCSGTKLALACTGECEIKKRNARLAEALGISEARREGAGVLGKVTWSAELVGVARGMGPRFMGIVEKAFADFIASDKKLQVLPHMRPDQRKLVQDLASVYRMDAIMVDQEPHRSVQLIRRIDTRVPVPLLSQHVASSMGRLVDSRLVVGKGGNVGTGPSTGGTSVSTPGSAWGDAGGNGGTGMSAGRWNEVARSALGGGTPRSGSTTPARVPSPSGIGGASTLSGTKAGVWVSPLVQVLRGRESAGANRAGSVDVGTDGTAVAGTTSSEVQVVEVPDDWEDDA